MHILETHEGKWNKCFFHIHYSHSHYCECLGLTYLQMSSILRPNEILKYLNGHKISSHYTLSEQACDS